MSDDTTKELYRRMTSAEADLSEKRQAAMLVADKVYVNPKRAVDNMVSYLIDGKRTVDGLVAKLEERPAHFGTMKGHLGSGNALSIKGVKEMLLSKKEVQALPGLVKEALDADKKFIALREAVKQRGGLESGREEIDYMKYFDKQKYQEFKSKDSPDLEI